MITNFESLLIANEESNARILTELEVMNMSFIAKIREHDGFTGLPTTDRCEEILKSLAERDAKFVKENLGTMYQLLTGLHDNAETVDIIDDHMVKLLITQCRDVNYRVLNGYKASKVAEYEKTFQTIKERDAALLMERDAEANQ